MENSPKRINTNRSSPEDSRREPLVSDFTKVNRANSLASLVTAILAFVFAITVASDPLTRNIMIVVFAIFLVLAPGFYLSTVALHKRFYYAPFIFAPIGILIGFFVAPVVAPFLIFLLFSLATAYAVTYGIRDIQYYILLCIVAILVYAFYVSGFNLVQKLTLSLWLSGSLLIFTYRDVQFGREIYNQRREVKEMTTLTENLRLSSERNQALLDHIADGAVALGENRRITLFNKAAQEMSGFSEEKMIGKSIETVLSLPAKEHHQLLEELYPAYPPLPLKPIIRQAAALHTKSKKKRLVNATFSPILKKKDGADVHAGYIATLHDVTREKELEEMKLDFVSMAAHELRTPLTSVRGYLSALQEEIASQLDKKPYQFLQRAQISTDQLVSVMENLLSVSRIEQSQVTLNLESINWTQFVKATVKNFELPAAERELKLKVESPEGLPRVRADRLRIAEVLNNLLQNAIIYTHSGSVTVKLTIDDNRQMVVTSVIDTGQGIPKKSLPHLFEKFYRVSGTLEQGSKGTGLGLYISKQITELHGGTIWAKSELGQGSTFSFSLPVAKTKDQK